VRQAVRDRPSPVGFSQVSERDRASTNLALQPQRSDAVRKPPLVFVMQTLPRYVLFFRIGLWIDKLRLEKTPYAGECTHLDRTPDQQRRNVVTERFDWSSSF
jgi:hypothetical protein